jgi:succinyl-diaminopimelate desuccinylase
VIADLDLAADPVELTARLVDIPSVSKEEGEIAAAVEVALRALPHLEVERSGNTVMARTSLGRPTRVVLAGHLDTVPVNENLPGRLVDDELHGLGAVDMKGGVAVMLHVASALTAPRHDLTFLFYDCEEIEARYNGLGRLERESPEWLAGDLAIVCEPSNAVIEAGCQGTMRARLVATGRRAHTARAWMGVNAIHALEPAMRTLATYQAREVVLDGCRYREGLQAVAIGGGVSGNVVPDEAVLTVNLRFAPDRSVAQAEAHLLEVFAGTGCQLTVTDFAAGALPGLTAPAAAELVAATNSAPIGKLGWTDVARFAALGMPALNFGPGDPMLAHTREEHVPIAQIRHCAEVLVRFLT